ncbi:DNA gyrase inhibitor YacG [Pseudochelatococcus lubricantis]|uniref:DNA gyrase inhibitor YacG n=1 Tax=Pseudochelatococcus lubricantis TaxID=1538102 RepID=UPI0035EBD49C
MADADDNNDNAVTPPAGGACPICGKEAQARWRPFCSKRCADIDLHRWLSGSYVIPASDEAEEVDGNHPDDTPDI